MTASKLCWYKKHSGYKMQQEFSKLSKDEKRDVWWERTKHHLFDNAYWGYVGIPIAVGDGDDRDWVLSKLEQEGFRYALFGDADILSQFVFVWID